MASLSDPVASVQFFAARDPSLDPDEFVTLQVGRTNDGILTVEVPRWCATKPTPQGTHGGWKASVLLRWLLHDFADLDKTVYIKLKMVGAVRDGVECDTTVHLGFAGEDVTDRLKKTFREYKPFADWLGKGWDKEARFDITDINGNRVIPDYEHFTHGNTYYFQTGLAAPRNRPPPRFHKHGLVFNSPEAVREHEKKHQLGMYAPEASQEAVKKAGKKGKEKASGTQRLQCSLRSPTATSSSNTHSDNHPLPTRTPPHDEPESFKPKRDWAYLLSFERKDLELALCTFLMNSHTVVESVWALEKGREPETWTKEYVARLREQFKNRAESPATVEDLRTEIYEEWKQYVDYEMRLGKPELR